MVPRGTSGHIPRVNVSVDKTSNFSCLGRVVRRGLVSGTRPETRSQPLIWCGSGIEDPRVTSSVSTLNDLRQPISRTNIRCLYLSPINYVLST